MSEMKTFLKSIHVENFRSLRKVDLPLKPLTVLVGPNASGKSNALKALDVLRKLMIDEKLSSILDLPDHRWAREASHINFQLRAQVEGIPTVYELEFNTMTDNPFAAEELLVDDVKVISVQRGEGMVQDENGENKTPYNGANKLALWSAGDYGEKPITNALAKFMKNWIILHFRVDTIRQDFAKSRDSMPLFNILSYWHQHDRERFYRVSKSLEAVTNFRIDQQDDRLYLLEWDRTIPLQEASDGTLRLIAYYTLLSLSGSPSLIAIEEPEHNLHPGALTEIAKIFSQMAERSQVIITTHSSQLLDAFSAESLSDSLGVLLLHNAPGRGTRVTSLEDILEDEAALDGWITDFGIGSAIFDSGLINATEEEPVCQP